MRKLYFIILSMFAFGLAQEAMAQDIPSAATLADAPNVCIKNVRSGKSVYAMGVNSPFGQTAGTPNLNNIFRFVKTGENMYKIFSVGRGQWVNNPKSGTYAASEPAAQVWYTGNVTSQNQFSISNQSGTEGNIAWNDLYSDAVTYWTATDAGSSWYVEKVTDGNVQINAYKPTRRLTSLQAGTEVMILNTTVDNDNLLRTGFLQAGESKFLPYGNVTHPLTFQEGTEYHVFILEQSTTNSGKWWLKSKATNKYVGLNGSVTSATGVDLTIEDFSAATRKAESRSLNDDGTWTPYASITPDTHVWMIGNGSTTNWNGNPNGFATWQTGHPFAFYEVAQVNTTLCGQMDAFLTATKTNLESLKNKVGGPVESTLTTLNNASSVSDKTTMEFFNQAFSALRTAAQAEVKLPEEGKTYVVVSVPNPNRAEASAYLKVNGNGSVSLSTGSDYPNDAKFVVRKLEDGKFVLANGRYNRTLQFTGNTERTLSEGYEASYSPIRIVSMDPSKAEVKLLVYRRPSTPSCAIIVNKQNNVLDKIDNEDWPGDQKFSIRFRLEEVNDYPATVNLRASADVQGAAAMSTWSAPYASVCPEGVKAYYASENGTVARMTAVEGAIPANQGVVLVGAEAGEKTPLPVAGEQVATITDNLLGNTAGQAATIADGSFVLSQKNSVTAFYKLSDYSKQLPANRAYLTASAAAGGSRQLVFGFDDATGIPTLQDAAQQNQPTYDLSGRAVSAKRQGLYIRGGKKFIVK